MASIEKGVISSFGSNKDRNGDSRRVKINPLSDSGAMTPEIVIPWYLRGKMGSLKVEDTIYYSLFEDGTGIILAKESGDWEGFIPGNIEVIGNVKLKDMESANVQSYNNHKHGGVESGSSKTSNPE